jgi:hypothetical protein
VPGSAAAQLTEAFDFVERDGEVFLHFAFFIDAAHAGEMQS